MWNCTLCVTGVWMAVWLAAPDPARAQEKPAVDAGAAGGARPAAEAPPKTLTVRLTVPAQPSFENVTKIRFAGRWAVAFDADDDAIMVYDLLEPRWFDWTRRAWTSRKQAEDWVEASRQRSAASLARPGVDEEAKKFVAAQLEPNFKVEKTDGGIRLSNDVFTYDVTAGPMPAEMVAAFAAQQQIGAYAQAVTERKLAPFPLLAVLKELESRKLLPERMEMTVRVRGTEQKLVTSMKLEPPDADHARKVDEALALAGGGAAGGTAEAPQGPRGPEGDNAAEPAKATEGKKPDEAPLPF